MGVLRPAGEFDTSYAYDMATIRRRWQWWLLFAFILALYTLPFYASQSVVSLVNRIAITKDHTKFCFKIITIFSPLFRKGVVSL